MNYPKEPPASQDFTKLPDSDKHENEQEEHSTQIEMVEETNEKQQTAIIKDEKTGEDPIEL